MNTDRKTTTQKRRRVAKITGQTRTGIERFKTGVTGLDELLGGDIAVLARTAEQFSDILAKNPFGGSDTKRLYFTLLAGKPGSVLLKTFLSTDFAPEQIRIVDTTIYTLYATKYSDSKFNNTTFERKLKVAATTRNLLQQQEISTQ